MLGQIERGESSPTISTLWKISSGLKVNFISLLDDNRNQLVLVKKDEIHPIKEENGKMIIYPILEEMILVSEGTLTIQVEQEVYELNKGDSLKFGGGLNHIYMNKGNEKVLFHNIEIYK